MAADTALDARPAQDGRGSGPQRCSRGYRSGRSVGLLYVKSPAALQGEEGRPGGLWAVPRHTAADIGALSLPQTAPASPGSPAAVPERIRILHTAPRDAVALATPGLDYV